MTVDTAADEDAFLALDPISDPGIDGEETGRAYTLADETVAFSIPGVYEGESENAEGVGLDSVYEFRDLLRIENRGTQTVEVYSTYSGNALAELALVHSEGILRENPPELDAGDHVVVGLHIDTRGSTAGDYDETLTLVANSPDD